MAVDPQRTPGTFGAPPPGAPHEFTHAEDPVALAGRARLAQQNERALAPLIVAPALRPAPQAPTPTPTPTQKVATIVPPSQSRLRIPGQSKTSMPSVTQTPAESRIILTDSPAAAAALPVGDARPELPGAPGAHEPPPVVQPPAATRPPIDPQTAALLNSPLAEAARRLQEQRGLTHQPAASNTDSPSRGMPQPIADPGKQITGGFGDAGDAQYYPLDGSELRELVRGLMSVIDSQIENDLRFSMAICYPRVSARVIVEIDGYAAGGDGGQYDPSFAITKVMPPWEKTPIDVARSRADEICFIVKADRREMTADGQSVSPPNAIRTELGLQVPRKQSVQTPTGRVIVDLPTH